MTQNMGDLIQEYEAELLVKQKAYEASPKFAIDEARIAAKFKIEDDRRQAWEDSLTPEELKEHFSEDEGGDDE